MTTATDMLMGAASAMWSREEVAAVGRHRGKINRGRPPPDWTGTTLTLWLVFHLLMSLAVWAFRL